MRNRASGPRACILLLVTSRVPLRANGTDEATECPIHTPPTAFRLHLRRGFSKSWFHFARESGPDSLINRQTIFNPTEVQCIERSARWPQIGQQPGPFTQFAAWGVIDKSLIPLWIFRTSRHRDAVNPMNGSKDKPNPYLLKTVYIQEPLLSFYTISMGDYHTEITVELQT